MTRRRSDALRLFRALSGSRAAQTRSREWLGHRARGDRPPVSLGDRASETNGRGYRLGNEWSRASTGAEGLIPRWASRGGHTHTHTTHTQRHLDGRRETAHRYLASRGGHTHQSKPWGGAPSRRRGLSARKRVVVAAHRAVALGDALSGYEPAASSCSRHCLGWILRERSGRTPGQPGRGPPFTSRPAVAAPTGGDRAAGRGPGRRRTRRRTAQESAGLSTGLAQEFAGISPVAGRRRTRLSGRAAGPSRTRAGRRFFLPVVPVTAIF